MLHAIFLAAAAATLPAPPTLRLPAGVRPVRQAVELTLAPDAEPYDGQIEVDLELARETAVLWLNASGLEVHSATLGDGAPARVVPGGPDFVGLLPEKPLPAGRVILRASFRGRVDHAGNEGLFAVQEAGDWYAFTQFEAVSARRAFPCFDEPAYKIPWRVTLRVPRGLPAFSNTPVASRVAEGDRDVVRFAETKPLPSYLVAFAAGPFDTVEVGAVGRGRVPARLVVPKGRGADTAWARETTPRVLEILEEYFDRPYPYEKLDQVAIPGVGYAMEHPGLVTYGMGLVVQREKEQTIDTRRGWVSVAAHELAHQWFGDLVTMAWWDDTWLNESFASWMGTKATDRFRPEWGTALDRVEERTGALEADSLDTARRIRQPIVEKRDIEDAFDGITYAKGEAVLEMMESWLGEADFRRGVQAYLDRHAWKNATVSDFASALSQAAGRDVSPVLSSFLDQTGAPVVSTEARCGGSPRLVVRQRPYRALGSADRPRTWRLPVCARVAGRDEPACTILEAAEAETPLGACPDWSYANAGAAGYYRSLVSAADARRALDSGGLSPAERLALAGEARALVASGDLAAGDALSLVPRLAADSERRVVGAAVALVGDLEPIVDDAHADAYRAFVREVFGPRARAMGLAARADESEDDRLLRRVLASAAGRLGSDPDLRRQARETAVRWLDDPGVVDADTLGVVLRLASAAPDRALFERVRDEAVKEEDRARRQRLLGVLGSMRDPALAREALALTLDPRIDPREAISIPFGLAQARETRRLAVDFVTTHYDAIVARLGKGMMSALGYLPAIAGSLCSTEDARAAEAFFAPRLAAVEGSRRTLAQTVERVGQCAARRDAQQASAHAFLDGRPVAAAR